MRNFKANPSLAVGSKGDRADCIAGELASTSMTRITSRPCWWLPAMAMQRAWGHCCCMAPISLQSTNMTRVHCTGQLRRTTCRPCRSVCVICLLGRGAGQPNLNLASGCWHELKKISTNWNLQHPGFRFWFSWQCLNWCNSLKCNTLCIPTSYCWTTLNA